MYNTSIFRHDSGDNLVTWDVAFQTLYNEYLIYFLTLNTHAKSIFDAKTHKKYAFLFTFQDTDSDTAKGRVTISEYYRDTS